MLCFETSETSAVVNLSAATGLAQRVKSLGCRFALDNFGSGLSSFSYLKGLPLDFVKIDGRFVRDMLVDPMDRAVVESIHRIGRVIGLRTVAEFVETPEHLAAIRSVGFDAAQGFAIGAGERFDAPLATRTTAGLPLH
jgi:EAL domain-containing protein (putative c-di-GMP-specific phosphodiesterase class I)